MINQTELNSIKNAITNNSIDSLLDKYQADIDFKALDKKDTFLFTPHKATKEIIATKISESFCVYKEEGYKGTWYCSHIKTGLSALNSKKTNVMAMVKELKAQDWFSEFDKDMLKYTNRNNARFTPNRDNDDAFLKLIRKYRK